MELASHLDEGLWDIILADSHAGGLAPEVILRAIRKRDLDLSLIVVCDRIGEVHVVRLLKMGVSDIVLRDDLSRLVPAIERSLEESAERFTRRNLERERLHLEHELRLQDQLVKIAASLPGVIYAFRRRPDGSIHFPYASPSLKRLFGLQVEDVAVDGRPVFERIHAEDLPAIQASIAESARQMTPWHGEFRVRLPSGLHVWLEGQSIPQREADGSILWQGFVADVTERKEAEAKRRESERRFQEQEATLHALLDTIPDLVFFKDAKLNYLGCNQAFEAYAGLTARELTGKSDAAMSRIEVAECFRRNDKAVLDTDRAQRVEQWIPDRQGVRRLFDTLKTPFHGPDGRLAGLIGISRDVTEGERARKALNESRARYQSLFTNLLEACAYGRIVAPRDGAPDFVYVDVNAAFERLTGLRGARGKRVSELIPGIQAANPDMLATFERVTHTGVPERFETYVPPLGNWFAVSVFRPEPGHFVATFDVITARKQAELALRKSEERFRTTLDTMMEGCQIIGFNGHCLYVNESAAQHWPHKREGRIGKTLEAVFPGIEHTPLYADIRCCMETRQSLRTEREFVYDGGTHGWFDLSLHPVPEGVFILSIDITQRRQSEEILRQGESRFRLLFDQVSKLAVQGYEADGTVRMWNKASEALYGYTADEAIGRNIADLIIPDAMRGPVKLAIQQMMETGAGHQAEELVLQRKDGSRVPVYSNHTVVDVRGRGKELYCIDIDLTDRKRDEASLRLQSAALEAAANAIYITDHHGTIQWINRAFADVTGYTADESIGRNPRDLVRSGEHDEAFYANLWATILDGRVWRGEIINRRKDRSLCTEDTTITPVRNEQGEIVHFIAIMQDVTDRKRLEQQLLRTQRLESVGRLASGIAHDLNNILAPMLLGAPILRECTRDPGVLDIVNAIESSAERGAAIIRQLLTFGRGMDTRRVPIQLQSLVREMMRIIVETFPKNIVARQSIPADLPLVEADATQVHQVLLNLCVNARDAMPQGGLLNLSLAMTTVDAAMAEANAGAHPGDHVVLCVADSGTGIAPDLMDKIFDPFFTTKGVGEGTGLGLSTVLGIVRSHKGFIRVDSQPGKGTAFSIYLPSCDASSEGGGAPAVQPIPRGHGETVLIVDDEEHVRRVTRRLLEQYGYHVLEARQGTEGLALFAANEQGIDVVLTDLHMPVMDGTTLIRKLRQQYDGVRIVSMSGHLRQPALAEELIADPPLCIPKPFSAATLTTAIQRVLATPRPTSGTAP